MPKRLMERLFGSWGPHPAEDDDDDWGAERRGVDEGPGTDPPGGTVSPTVSATWAHDAPVPRGAEEAR